jgi:hypothetical protein
MVNVVKFPSGGKSSISPLEADRDLRWAVFRMLQAYGPKIAAIRLEEAAQRIRENLA